MASPPQTIDLILATPQGDQAARDHVAVSDTHVYTTSNSRNGVFVNELATGLLTRTITTRGRGRIGLSVDAASVYVMREDFRIDRFRLSDGAFQETLTIGLSAVPDLSEPRVIRGLATNSNSLFVMDSAPPQRIHQFSKSAPYAYERSIPIDLSRGFSLEGLVGRISADDDLIYFLKHDTLETYRVSDGSKAQEFNYDARFPHAAVSIDSGAFYLLGRRYPIRVRAFLRPFLPSSAFYARVIAGLKARNDALDVRFHGGDPGRQGTENRIGAVQVSTPASEWEAVGGVFRHTAQLVVSGLPSGARVRAYSVWHGGDFFFDGLIVPPGGALASADGRLALAAGVMGLELR